MTNIINRDQLMHFMRQEDFEDTLYTLSDCDKIECMTVIAQSINQEMETLIQEAITKWELWLDENLNREKYE